MTTAPRISKRDCLISESYYRLLTGSLGNALGSNAGGGFESQYVPGPFEDPSPLLSVWDSWPPAWWLGWDGRVLGGALCPTFDGLLGDPTVRSTWSRARAFPFSSRLGFQDCKLRSLCGVWTSLLCCELGLELELTEIGLLEDPGIDGLLGDPRWTSRAFPLSPWAWTAGERLGSGLTWRSGWLGWLGGGGALWTPWEVTGGGGATTGAMAEAMRMNMIESLLWTMLNMK